MREGALDILDRNRQVFYKSLIDGIGKFDAGADFYLSAISAERRGYILSQEDEALLKMFNSVVKKAEESQISGPSDAYDLNTEGEGMEQAQGLTEQQMSYAMGHGAGMNLADNPSYDKSRIVPPEPGQGLAGRKWEMVDGDVNDPYRTHNYLGSDMNPLHGEYHNIVGDFYVHPDDPYAESESQKAHHREVRWEQWVKDNEDHGFLHNKFHYGPLDTVHDTNHAFYEHDYLEWTKRNQRAVDELTASLEEQGMDEDQVAHELRKRHINEKKAEWKENLGFMDYFFGMEWLTPEQRNAAYDHMRKHGADPEQAFRTNTHNGNPNWMPRFIRNFHQRFSGLYNHWVRDPGRPGEGLMIRPKALPSSAIEVNPSQNYEAMRETQTPGKPNAYDRAIAHHNKMEEDRYIVEGLGPYKPISNAEVPVMQKVKDEFGRESLQVVGYKKLQGTDKSGRKEEYYPGYQTMRMLLGVDENHQLYPAGEHPTYGELWDGGEFTQEEIDEIFEKRAVYAKQLAGIGRMARNHAPMHYGFAMDNEEYDYMDPEHGHETLSTYWQLPFKGKGGLAKHPNELFDKLHHHTLSYKEIAQQPKEEGLDLSGFYGEGFLPEEEQEEAQVEYEPETEGVREHSLLFSRTKSGIEGRHEYDKEGVVRDYGMMPFLAPFGQKENQMFEMRQGKNLIRTNVRGNMEDSVSNMNPHNIVMSSSIAGTGGYNAQFARHGATVDSAYNNQVLSDYHQGRRTGDVELARTAHRKLGGTGALQIAHPFHAKGGSLSDERMMSHGAHSYALLGTMLGAANAPMNPHQDVLHITDRRIQPTLRNHEEDFASLRQHPDELAVGDLEAEIEALEQRYSSDKAKAVTDEQHDMLDKEYERTLERLKEEHQLRPHIPTTFAEMGVPRRFNPAGSVTPVLSRQPPSPATEEYEDAIAEMSLLQEQMEVRREIKDEAGMEDIRRRMAEKNQQLDDLEAQLEAASEKRGQRFSPDGHDSTLQDKLVADTNAMTSAAVHLKNLLQSDPELFSHIFNPNLDHETVEANMRMFAMMANDYLNTVPHDQHGIHTRGHNRVTKEGLSGQLDIGSQVKQAFQGHETMMSAETLGDNEALMQQLGLDPSNEYHNATFLDYIRNTFLPNYQQDPSYSAPIMTMRQFLQQLHPDLDLEKEHESLKKDKRSRNTEFLKLVNRIYNTVGHRAEERNSQLGLHHHLAFNSDPRRQRKQNRQGETVHETKPSAGGSNMQKNENDYWNVMQKLDSILTNDPSVPMPESVTETSDEMTAVPVDQFGPNAHSVHSLYNSTGLRHEFGDEFRPNFKYRISRNGNVSITPVPEGHAQRLIQPLGKFWERVAPPEWMEMLRHPDHQVHRDGLNRQDRMAAQFKADNYGITRHSDKHSTTKSEIGLADLTNPDIIRKDLGKEVPILQPMHRIFELDDLEDLRGFTGDWIVSHMPEGERGFVKKEDDEVSSKSFSLSDEDKENFKKVTDEDFHADVIKTEEGYYIFDVIEYAGKAVHDVPLNDRIKIVRGGLEGIENIHVPSASDTRLTDDEGLKTTVKNLMETHEALLLRDAKSVYMVGELRHPKWVMLKPGSDVVLRVLERRGTDPYTYRLGTGPITRDEEIGDRAVESEGEMYMDVGVAFNSPEKFNEGDHVRVNVANVGKVETTGGDDVYTLTGSKIIGEAEGEGLVSRETLGMLAKSEGDQWLCEISRAKSGLRVTMPQGDVLYKCTQRGDMWTVHSPLANNGYLIRLAESQRPYWSPVAGALLKAGLEIAEKEEVHESEGEAEPLIEPHKEEGTNWWEEKQKKKVLVKGLMLIDKFLKSSAGSVGGANAGAKGLGIDYATPIESPMGPTNLNDEKTMPDYDNRKRPGEDSTIEPKSEEEEDEKRMTVPTEQGVLEVSSDKAVFHT